jgi:P4 family phage/plasmid primase-like protien
MHHTTTQYLDFISPRQPEGEELRALNIPAIVRPDGTVDRLVRKGALFTSDAALENLLLDAGGVVRDYAGVYIVQNVSSLKQADRDAWGFLGESKDGAKKATGRQHITHRRAFYVDCDPDRTEAGVKLDSSSTNSSDEEFNRAMEVAAEVYEFLAKQLGSPSYLGNMSSGNGAQVHIALDSIPVDRASDQMIEDTLLALANKFNRPGVTIDTGVGGRERLAPLPGTWKRKGPHSERRPHRMVEFNCAADVRRLGLAGLKQLHAAVTAASPLTDDQRQRKERKAARLERMSQASAESGVIDSIFKQVKAGFPVARAYEHFGFGHFDDQNRFVPHCIHCGKDFTDGQKGFVFLPGNISYCHYDRCSGDEVRTVIDVTMEGLGLDEHASLKAAQYLVSLAAKEGIALPPIESKVRSFPLTEIGNAERLVDKDGDRIRFLRDSKQGHWLVYNGSHWEQNDGAVAHLAMGIIKDLGFSTEDAVRKHAAKSASAHGVHGMVTLAACIPSVSIGPDALDQNDWLLNVNNGTIDLKTGSLRPFDKTDLITSRTGVNFDPKAKCPTWEKFLETTFGGDKELITYMQKYVGCSLTGDTSEQRVFIFTGTGSNGKSTFVGTIQRMLGEYAWQTNPSLLLQKRNEAHPTERIALRGRRAVFCSEPDENKALSLSTLKALSGDDIVNGRGMCQDEQNFTMRAKIALLVNSLPRVPGGGDDAFWRRISVVPFNQKFKMGGMTEGVEADKSLPKKLAAELEGILAWAVEGCLLWQKEGMEEPEAVKAAREKYRASEDKLAEFLQDCCVLSKKIEIRGPDLYAAYVAYCARSHEKHVIDKVPFGRILTKKGFKSRSSNGTIWMGLGLREAMTPAEICEVERPAREDEAPTLQSVPLPYSGKPGDIRGPDIAARQRAQRVAEAQTNALIDEQFASEPQLVPKTAPAAACTPEKTMYEVAGVTPTTRTNNSRENLMERDKNALVDQARRGSEMLDAAIASLDAIIASLDAIIAALQGHLASGRPLPEWLYGKADKALMELRAA